MELLTIKQASEWATGHLGKEVSESNISYLIQYGCVKKIGENGSTLISKEDLFKYYEIAVNGKANQWRRKLGTNLNWHLSFDELSEAERTKHVHRLHLLELMFRTYCRLLLSV